MAVLILFFIAAAAVATELGLADAAANDGQAGEDDEHPYDRAYYQYRRYGVIALLRALWEHGIRVGKVISSCREQRKRTLRKRTQTPPHTFLLHPCRHVG